MATNAPISIPSLLPHSLVVLHCLQYSPFWKYISFKSSSPRPIWTQYFKLILLSKNLGFERYICSAKTLKRKPNNNSIHMFSFQRFSAPIQTRSGRPSDHWIEISIFVKQNEIFDVWKYVFWAFWRAPNPKEIRYKLSYVGAAEQSSNLRSKFNIKYWKRAKFRCTFDVGNFCVNNELINLGGDGEMLTCA